MSQSFVERIRQIFSEDQPFYYWYAYDSEKKKSEIEGVDYRGARALHWALDATGQGPSGSYGWIDFQERSYLEKIGVSKTLLDDLDRRKPVVDLWLYKIKSHQFIPLFSTQHLLRPYYRLLKNLSEEDADRLVRGALAVFERDWLPNLEDSRYKSSTPTVEVAKVLCQFFDLFGDKERYILFKQRFHQIGGPDICY